MVIGIPRGLHTYSHYPMWQRFLYGLGLETLVSPFTTRDILAAGVRCAPSEICLPVKAYLGHVEWLRNRCDAILIPRVVCLKQDGRLRFGCPKALALPDLVRSLISPVPRILELNLDERLETARRSYLGLARLLNPDHKGGSAFEQGVREQAETDLRLRSGAPFATFWQGSDPTCGSGFPAATGTSQSAVRSPQSALKSSFVIRHSSLPNPQSAVRSPQSPVPAPRPLTPALRIGVIAHPYLLFDSILSIGLKEKLENLGAQVFTPGTVPETATFPESARTREICWYYEQELLRSAGYLLAAGRIDGLLLVSSFSCGTSAVINEVINRELNHSGIPMSTLLLDEHTAEAGLMTRLEAFVDLVKHRTKHKGLASSKSKGQSPKQRIKS
jgi:predicted nucleotide-binding protein (sugar kinase/HSP70/actin superfamily)